MLYKPRQLFAYSSYNLCHLRTLFAYLFTNDSLFYNIWKLRIAKMRDLVFYPRYWVLDGNLSPNSQRRSRRLRRYSFDDNAVLRRPVLYRLPGHMPRGVRVYSVVEGQQHQSRAPRNMDRHSLTMSHMHPLTMSHTHPYRALLMETMVISLASAGLIWIYSKSSTLE